MWWIRLRWKLILRVMALASRIQWLRRRLVGLSSVKLPVCLTRSLSLVSFTLAGTRDPAALKVDRRVMLARQLKDKGVLFAGLQETRRSLEVSQCGDFHVIAAPAVGGMGGCELWTNTQFCYLKNSKVSPRHCTMVHSDHRLLVVNVRAKGLQCTLVVAHAPIEPKTVADRELNKKWWDSLNSTIMERKIAHRCERSCW